MEPQTPSAGELIPRGKLFRGVVTFVLLTAAGFAALYHFSAKADARQVVASLSTGFLALAALGAVADLLIGAVRYQIFLRRIKPGTSLWLPIRADLANRFVGAVTPSQTGGGPAQVFVLWRGGIPIPDALSFLLINFLSTLVFFLVAGGFTAWMFRARFPGGAIHLLVQYGFVAFAGCLAVMLVGLVRPDWLAFPLARWASRLEGRTGSASRLAHRASSTMAESVDRYRDACTRFIRDDPLLPVWSFLLTVVLYLNKFTLAWLVMRGLGVPGDYVTTLAVQALLHFILYVAPSPGGSGIAEISTGALMAIVMPAHLLTPFTLAYRFFLLYLPATVGAVVILREVKRGRTPAEAQPRLRPTAKGRPRASTATPAAILALCLVGGGLQGQAPRDTVSTTRDHISPDDIEAIIIDGLLAPTKDSAKAAFKESVRQARAWVACSEDDPDAHYALAVALGYHLEHQGIRTKLRMAGEVRLEAERALELSPNHPGAHHVLGRLHAAAMRLNRIARLVARKILGASVLEGASWDRAEHHFREAWLHDPSSPRHAMELGALLIDTDRPEQARMVLEEATRLDSPAIADSLAAVRARALLGELLLR